MSLFWSHLKNIVCAIIINEASEIQKRVKGTQELKKCVSTLPNKLGKINYIL
jgi:hypothetical protein